MASIDQSYGQGRPAAGGAVSQQWNATAKAAKSLPWPVMLYLICVIVPIGFQAGPLAMTTLRLMLLVVTIPLMINILRGQYGKVLITDILFAAHITWAAVALAVNNPEQVIQQIGSVGIEFLGGYGVGRAFIRTPEAFASLCRVLVAFVCVSLPFVLMETQTGRSLPLDIIRSLPGISAPGDINNPPRLGLERAQFTFAHPIHYGFFCSVAMSLAFVGLKGVTSNGWRFFSSALVGFCGFLALSSGALLAIFLQIGLFIWAAMFARVEARWWILLGLFVLAYIVIDILSDRTPIHVFLHYGTFSAHTAYNRLLIFEWGMVNVRANPIFGIGLNDWVRPWWMHSGSMDNFWMVNAVRYGVPGFALLAIGYVLPYFRIIFRDFKSDPEVNQLRLAWAFTFAGITFTLCTVHIWTNVYSFIFFMFGAGLWMIYFQPGSVGAAGDAPTEPPPEQARGPVFSRFETPPAENRRGENTVDKARHRGAHPDNAPNSSQDPFSRDLPDKRF